MKKGRHIQDYLYRGGKKMEFSLLDIEIIIFLINIILINFHRIKIVSIG